MPLESGKSKAAFRHNIKVEREAGKPEAQAVAIAYKESGEDETQKQAKAMLDGKHVSGRDRAKLKR